MCYLIKEERIMKWNTKGHGAFSAVSAGALVLSLAACDQIQSLWKSEDKTNPVAGAVAQPKPEAKIEVVKAIEIPKSLETPKPPVDENKALASKVKSALGDDPALKFLAIDATASDGAVTLYGTANNRALREKAARVASNVAGVKSVKNELVIVAGS
jgi:osmotically-inducible protein OsmY